MSDIRFKSFDFFFVSKGSLQNPNPGVDILLGFHTPGVWNTFTDFVEGYITLDFNLYEN